MKSNHSYKTVFGLPLFFFVFPNPRQYLGTQLLRGQLEGGDDFLGQIPGIREAKGEERDLGDQGVVGHHHGHWSEQRLCQT